VRGPFEPPTSPPAAPSGVVADVDLVEFRYCSNIFAADGFKGAFFFPDMVWVLREIDFSLPSETRSNSRCKRKG